MNANANQVAQQNTNLQSLQQALVLQHRALLQRLSTTTYEKEANAISLEMDEIYLRIRVCTRLLFRQTTDAINQKVEEVVAVSAELRESIATIEKLTDVIKKISRFLGLVDKILDKVKVI